MAKHNEHGTWHRATRCGTNACVEVAKVGDQFLIRDSKNTQTPPLAFTSEEWAAFVQAIKAGEFPL